MSVAKGLETDLFPFSVSIYSSVTAPGPGRVQGYLTPVASWVSKVPAGLVAG